MINNRHHSQLPGLHCQWVVHANDKRGHTGEDSLGGARPDVVTEVLPQSGFGCGTGGRVLECYAVGVLFDTAAVRAAPAARTVGALIVSKDRA